MLGIFAKVNIKDPRKKGFERNPFRFLYKLSP